MSNVEAGFCRSDRAPSSVAIHRAYQEPNRHHFRPRSNRSSNDSSRQVDRPRPDWVVVPYRRASHGHTLKP